MRNDFSFYKKINHTSYHLPTSHLNFIYSEKVTEFCEISTLLLSTLHTDKGKMEISQNFVALSECMNFKIGKKKECK